MKGPSPALVEYLQHWPCRQTRNRLRCSGGRRPEKSTRQPIGRIRTAHLEASSRRKSRDQCWALPSGPFALPPAGCTGTEVRPGPQVARSCHPEGPRVPSLWMPLMRRTWRTQHFLWGANQSEEQHPPRNPVLSAESMMTRETEQGKRPARAADRQNEHQQWVESTSAVQTAHRIRRGSLHHCRTPNPAFSRRWRAPLAGSCAPPLGDQPRCPTCCHGESPQSSRHAAKTLGHRGPHAGRRSPGAVPMPWVLHLLVAHRQRNPS